MDKLNRVFNFNNVIKVNYGVILPIFFLCIIGLIALNSASSDTLGQHSVFYKQTIWLSIGILFLVAVQFLRNQFLYEYAYILYIALILLIIVTLFMPSIKNSTRWIIIGSFQFQPSEIGKITMVLVLARFLADYKDTFSDHQLIILCSLLSAGPLLLIFKQPDYGTGIIYFLPVLPMLFWSGIKFNNMVLYFFPLVSIVVAYDLFYFSCWMLLLVLTLVFLYRRVSIIVLNFIINVSFGLFNNYAWNELLSGYHRKRIISLFNPEVDHMGVGYQLFQSKVAIGSGGLFGKGLGEGTQSYLRFLPIKDSDFILSVISEEMGLLSILLIVVLFFCFIYYTLDASSRLFNKFYSLCLVGFSSIIFFHMIINMSMVIGIFPVIGLPLPFISYGGTFILTCLIIVGIINYIIYNDL